MALCGEHKFGKVHPEHLLHDPVPKPAVAAPPHSCTPSPMPPLASCLMLQVVFMYLFINKKTFTIAVCKLQLHILNWGYNNNRNKYKIYIFTSTNVNNSYESTITFR